MIRFEETEIGQKKEFIALQVFAFAEVLLYLLNNCALIEDSFKIPDEDLKHDKYLYKARSTCILHHLVAAPYQKERKTFIILGKSHKAKSIL